MPYLESLSSPNGIFRQLLLGQKQREKDLEMHLGLGEGGVKLARGFPLQPLLSLLLSKSILIVLNSARPDKCMIINHCY